MDDVRLGRLIRLLRRRHSWRQADLAARARIGQTTISLVERGHLDQVSLRTLRSILASLEASAFVEVRWRGGAIDRLLDEGHASLVEAFAAVLAEAGWAFRVEVSYSRYGERGSIDILGWHEASRSLLVVEIKTELASMEATLRKLDEKLRLAPIVARERFGWRASSVSRVLVIAEGSTARRRVARHEATLRSVLPLRAGEFRRWLSRPAGSTGGVLFLSGSDPRATKSGRARPRGSGQGPGRPKSATPRTNRAD